MSAAATLTLDDVKLDTNKIDFSDLEEKYMVEDDTSLDQYVVVDGAPIAPESKIPMLTKVLTKLFNNAGAKLAEDVENPFEMPIENGKTTGFLFVQFLDAKNANNAIRALNGKKLDAKHRLFLNKLTDIEKFSNISDEMPEVSIPEFKQTDYLKSWLLDENGRDQFISHFDTNVDVNWQKKAVVEVACDLKNFTPATVTWSNKGSYLISLHQQGLKTWGGENFELIRRISHPEVKLVDFSPNEKYMVSFSSEGIKLPTDEEETKSFVFNKENEGHTIVIWELATGLPLKTFALPPNIKMQEVKSHWPLIKWSYDSKYFARKGPDALAIYESEDMTLLDKKIMSIQGLQDFQFAPAGVCLATNKKDDLSHVISYWTPEQDNQSAKICLVEVPSRKLLRSVNIFQVSSCDMFWQGDAKYLCAKVTRHTKSKKTVFSNLEFFQLEDPQIPVDKIEFKDEVLSFAWEPRSDRFATITRLDEGAMNLAIPKNVVRFFSQEIESTTTKKLSTNIKALAKKYKNFKSIPDTHFNDLMWSPKGRFLAASAITASKGIIDIFDVDFDGEPILVVDQEQKEINVRGCVKKVGKIEGLGITNISWDPVGRYVACWSSSWRNNLNNGYSIFDLNGDTLVSESIDKFKQLLWRPRPESMLTNSDKKKVRKMLKEYSAQFEEQDVMEENAYIRELILSRKKMLEDWAHYRAQVDHKLKDLKIDIEELEVEEVEEVVIKEEVIETTEEVVN